VKTYLEDEGRVGGDDGRESTSTVGVVGGAGELGLLTTNAERVISILSPKVFFAILKGRTYLLSERELRNTLIPSLDDLSNQSIE
jgi:hypothetical protein